MTYLKKRIQAFGYAFSGLAKAFTSEAHLQLHFLATVFVIWGGIFFNISKLEWFEVSACIVLVISLELINSAIEKLCDLYSTEQNPKIKYIKDVAAGAVLIASIFAAIIGFMVFIPHIIEVYHEMKSLPPF